MGERDAPHDVGDGLRLGARRFQEFQARGRRGEEVADLDARAARPIGRLHSAFRAGVDTDRMAVGRALLQDPNWVLKVKEGRNDELMNYDLKALATLS